jgi:hypothetical protein
MSDIYHGVSPDLFDGIANEIAEGWVGKDTAPVETYDQQAGSGVVEDRLENLRISWPTIGQGDGRGQNFGCFAGGIQSCPPGTTQKRGTVSAMTGRFEDGRWTRGSAPTYLPA